MSGEAPFGGFVTGGAAVTLPAQFFAELLPEIDDEAELRATLYALYAIGRQRGALRAVRGSRLAAESPLRRALAGCGGPGALEPALRRAEARGSLLALPLDDGDALWFANTEAGRRNLMRVRAGALPAPGASPAAAPPPPGAAEWGAPAPARVYEQEIGALTPAVAEALAAAAGRWPAEWIADALREAARRNARSWAYAEAILRRWEAEGRDGTDGEGGKPDAEAGRGAGADPARPPRRDHGPYERVVRRS